MHTESRDFLASTLATPFPGRPLSSRTTRLRRRAWHAVLRWIHLTPATLLRSTTWYRRAISGFTATRICAGTIESVPDVWYQSRGIAIPGRTRWRISIRDWWLKFRDLLSCAITYRRR